MLVTFGEWTQGRTISSLGTNSGAPELPFQSWRHVKEAFAPELVSRAISESPLYVRRCLDPFGGSGTTALACQFLGVHPITVEVNPFLADLIEAKLLPYDADSLARDLRAVMEHGREESTDPETVFAAAPLTFVEPGVDRRWVFDRPIAARIAAFRTAIQALANERHRRLFRVLLGGILVEVSNIVVSGKGRRYRKGWERRRRDPDKVDILFYDTAHRAIGEIHRFRNRPGSTSEVLRGDSRDLLSADVPCDVAVFSPPYPNSFDYTDVYNLELWTLGYLTGKEANHALRSSTLCSHVQISRNFPPPPTGSGTLARTLAKLDDVRSRLWNRSIPEMVGGYFADLTTVLSRIYCSLTAGGLVWMVLGDSRYAHVRIETAAIVSELAVSAGWVVNRIEPSRSMRASPQQGGCRELVESLVVLSKL